MRLQVLKLSMHFLFFTKCFISFWYAHPVLVLAYVLLLLHKCIASCYFIKWSGQLISLLEWFVYVLRWWKDSAGNNNTWLTSYLLQSQWWCDGIFKRYLSFSSLQFNMVLTCLFPSFFYDVLCFHFSRSDVIKEILCLHPHFSVVIYLDHDIIAATTIIIRSIGRHCLIAFS